MRREVQFPTLKESEASHWRPKKSDDPDMIRVLTDKNRAKGTAILAYQKVGADALVNAFDRLTIKGSEVGPLRVLSGLAASAALGTAFYTFGENKEDEVAFRRTRFAQMYDVDTGSRASFEDLKEVARIGLQSAADRAGWLESAARDGENTTSLHNEALGRSCAMAAFNLAAIHDGLNLRPEYGSDLMYVAWLSAKAAMKRSNRLTETTGKRPSIAGLADAQSDFRREIHDDPSLLPSPAREVLLGKIESSRKTFLRVA